MLGAEEGRALAAAAGTDPEQFRRVLEHTGTLSPMMRDLLGTRGRRRLRRRPHPAHRARGEGPACRRRVGADLEVALPATTLTLERVAFAMGGDEPT